MLQSFCIIIYSTTPNNSQAPEQISHKIQIYVWREVLLGAEGGDDAGREKSELIESTNVCNLVVLDTWYMARAIEKYISHSIAERYRWCGIRLAYNISSVLPPHFPPAGESGKNLNKFAFAIRTCMQSQIHYAAFFSLPFHKFKWNIAAFAPSIPIKDDCIVERAGIKRCCSKNYCLSLYLLLL